MQKTLLIRGSGGLSNRLQAVLAGIAHCLITGRALCVDWRDGMYSDDFSDVFSRWFTVQGVTSLTAPLDCAGASIFPPFWRDWINDAVAVEYLFENDHLSPGNLTRTSIDFSQTAYAEDILVGWGADLQAALAVIPVLQQQAGSVGLPFLAGIEAMDIIRWLARNCLELQPHLRQKVDNFAVQYFTRPHTIGLHIRYTDLQSPLEAMLNCMRTIVTSESTIFLCTDNIHVQSTVSRIFPHTVFTAKVFPAGGEPLHCFVPELSNVQKGEEALIDMYLLSKCHELVYYNQSSFSRIPLLLRDFPTDKVHVL